jgi:hypothetical protein
MEAHGVPCEVLNLSPLCLTLVPLSPGTVCVTPSLPGAHCRNPASCPICQLRHQSILKYDHGPQEGLDISTDLTVTSTHRQIMIFAHTFVSVRSVPVDLTIDR